jgi:dipeptidyl aminopeptidase/acylaminoacyl peptidase
VRLLAPSTFVLAACVISLLPLPAEPAPQNPVTAQDFNLLRTVADPQMSPDGAWVAYTVRDVDVAADRRNTTLYMASWDGTQTVRLTRGQETDSKPRWSPDGTYLGFLTSRDSESSADQLWVLSRAGGEAEKLTDLPGGVTDYAWSPDGKRVVLVAQDPDPDAPSSKGERHPRPIVINRFYFKEDETGYLRDLHKHLYLFDVASRRVEVLTLGRFDEQNPSWSPDGRSLAFLSKRADDPDRTEEFGLYVLEARVGAAPRQLTTLHGESGDSEWMTAPIWSPDGARIAFVAGGEPKLVEYAVHNLLVIPSAGGAPQLLTGALDRNVTDPRWSADGKSLYFLLEDDRNQFLARVPAAGGTVDRVLTGRRDVQDYALGPKGRIALLQATPDRPDEVDALADGRVRPLSRQNDAWLAQRRLATLEELSVRSPDGTAISGFMLKPPDYVAGKRYPTLLRIHGGPVAQSANRFNLEWQAFAGHGYVVVAGNPRGSSGRGEAFAKAIYANWAEPAAQDVLALVDQAVASGIADPQRLGVGGWSYGAILTDNIIVRDSRFKAATSGAGQGNPLAGYGTDEYIRDYETELGVPWQHLDAWLRNSKPFLNADRIKTPTLFLCGDEDFNVPLLNSEQMYQALKSLGVETRLVIYPGQYHGLSRPSFLRDRMERYLDWYDRHLGRDAPAPPATPAH